jgi:hypothetical protein
MTLQRVAAAAWFLALASCPGRISDADKQKFLGCQLDVETDIFEAKCGIAGCHDATTKQNNLDLQSPGIADRLKNGISTCMGDPLLDLIPNKLTATPKCGATMPVGNPLTTDEVKCVDEYIANLADSGTSMTPDSGSPDGGM